MFSATETGTGNEVTCSEEEETLNIESLSLRDTDSQTESRANDDAMLSRDTQLGGVGARPKTTKELHRKNTPAVLPKVASLYGSLPSPEISLIVDCLSLLTRGPYILL